MKPRVILWAAVSGFIALSWEIVWARVFNFVSGSRAPVFGFMLAAYLLGLAIGSLASRRWFKTEMWGLAVLVRWASVVAFLVAPLTGIFAGWGLWHWGYGFVAMAGALLGVVFPMLCHASVKADDSVGQSLSVLYFANIVGSGAGSLLTGFVLMDVLKLSQLSVLLLLVGWGWGMSIGPVRGWKHTGLLGLLVIATVWPMHSLWERLQYKEEFNGTMRFPLIVESKHGVITVDTNKRIYGNGAYDGMIETQLEPGSWMVRPYFLSAVHPSIRRVLVIGVASGAWTQILAHHPQVEEIVAVELSHGYLEVIEKTPEVSSILHNPKVELVIDDGRRWLRRHPEAKFDAIVMNTTHHWREFASALLSVEFLREVKSHLSPGGIAFWNCTDSPRAARTGMEVFPHCMMVMNHCLASDSPLRIDAAHWSQVLRDYRIQGRRLFHAQTDAAKLGGVLKFVEQCRAPTEADKWTWMDRALMEQHFGQAALITDDNLGHEY